MVTSHESMIRKYDNERPDSNLHRHALGAIDLIQLLRRWASQKYAWQIWLIPFVLISPAIYIIPADVFTQYPWTREYTDFIASIVPMINRTAHLHPQPDKFRAFYAYAWSWLPLFALLNHIDFKTRREIGFKIPNPSPIKSLLVIALCFWGVYLFYFAPGDGGFTLKLMTFTDPRAKYFRSDYLILFSGPIVTYGFILLVTGCREFTYMLFKEMKNFSKSR
jgi:hypothetical protein